MATTTMKIDILYLNTLKRMLIDLYRCNGYQYKKIARLGPWQVVRAKKIDIQKRIVGEDWPEHAESMIGLRRMDNLQKLIADIIENNIEGDLLEAGTWRGGASIFMKANLLVHNSDKKLYVCDSFEGLPKPAHEEDTGDIHYKFDYLAVSLDEVIANFIKYGLLTQNVVFVKGWFKDTMPRLSNKKFSLIRLDGDMYESTMDVLENIYHCLSPGGYVIIDDYSLPPCRTAVHRFRAMNNITGLIIPIDNTAAYWQKT